MSLARTGKRSPHSHSSGASLSGTCGELRYPPNPHGSHVRCSVCVMPLKNSQENEGGICADCLAYRPDTRDRDQEEDAFRATVESYRSTGSEYDVLVPLSGGVESTFVLYYLTHICHARTAAWTLNLPSLRETARRNIRHSVALSDVAHRMESPLDEGDWFRAYRTAMRNGCGPCLLCSLFRNAALLTIATEFGTPLVAFGFAPSQAERNLRSVQMNAFQKRELLRMEAISLKADLERAFRGDTHILHKVRDRYYPHLDRYINKRGNAFDSIIPYSYINWERERVIDALARRFRFEVASPTVAHTNCWFEPIRGYVDSKIGHLSYEREVSYEVRTGAITRQEGLDNLAMLGITAVHEDVLDRFLHLAEMSRDEFDRCIESF